jgi:choline dehydrogenase
LKSIDPRDPPVIDFHSFLEGNDTTGQDLTSILNGVKLARQMNSQLSSLVKDEAIPGPAVQSDTDTATFIRNEAWGHHASCSNRMGRSSDPMAVVDNNFRVFGTKNLRVVDASVFPRIPGYFPMIPIMMMSEKASDAILDDAGGHKKSISKAQKAGTFGDIGVFTFCPNKLITTGEGGALVTPLGYKLCARA